MRNPSSTLTLATSRQLDHDDDLVLDTDRGTDTSHRQPRKGDPTLLSPGR